MIPILELVCLLLLWLYCACQMLVVYKLITFKNEGNTVALDLPEISILIAARNESNTINTCLKALRELNYPLHKIHLFIGDDASTDNTYALAMQWQHQFIHFQCIQINKINGLARAKANVIAELMQHVQTEFVFVTDADIQVNPNWIQCILPYFKHASLVSGVTIIQSESLLGSMQSFEWMLGFSNLFAFEKMGLPSTAVGNNMAFTKRAYKATGGYENIPFSVTEDLALTIAIRNKGFQIQTVASSNAVHVSEAQKNLYNLLHQRKRWLIGAAALPLKWKAIFMLQGLFLPACIILCFVQLKLALLVFGVKCLLQILQFVVFSKRIQFPLKWQLLPVFFVYQEFIILATVLFYLLPIKMNWKQRNYHLKNEPIN